MKRTMVVLALGAALLVGACGGSAAEEPTPTPEPTPTLEPTAPPEPTATPTPEPTPTPELTAAEQQAHEAGVEAFVQLLEGMRDAYQQGGEDQALLVWLYLDDRCHAIFGADEPETFMDGFGPDPEVAALFDDMITVLSPDMYVEGDEIYVAGLEDEGPWAQWFSAGDEGLWQFAAC